MRKVALSRSLSLVVPINVVAPGVMMPENG
jgi:hypothetical protein